MVATIAERSEHEVETLKVELRGRRFPLDWDEPPKQPTNRIRKLQESPRQASLPELLGEDLWRRLAWSGVPADATEVKPLVESYISSLSQLEGFRRDVEKLIRAACQCNIEFRQAAGETNANARDEALKAKLDEMLNDVVCDSLRPRNIVDARLVSQPTPVVRERLEAALADAVTGFTTQFFELLAKLVDLELFGLVEWFPNNCCTYHFFKRVILQENDGRGPQRVIAEKFFNDGRNANLTWQVVGTRTIEETRGQGRHVHRFARHQHDVMNAIHTSIDNSRVIMPPHVDRLIEAVPDWLQPFVQVIDGDIVRERIVERDIKVESWADVQVRDEPIFGCEPAVIIGPYVLTGWGPREVTAEQARRRAVKNDGESRVAGRQAPILAVVAAVMTVATLVTWILAMSSHVAQVFSVLAITTVLLTTWQAAFDFATSRRTPSAALWAHWVTSTVGCSLGLILVLIARLSEPWSWVTPVTLLAAAATCYLQCRRIRESR